MVSKQPVSVLGVLINRPKGVNAVQKSLRRGITSLRHLIVFLPFVKQWARDMRIVDRAYSRRGCVNEGGTRLGAASMQQVCDCELIELTHQRLH